MKKLLDSDWLRAVQFKCNTSAKSVTPVQMTYNGKFSKPMISSKTMNKVFFGNFEKKVFLNAKKWL